MFNYAGITTANSNLWIFSNSKQM